MSIFAYGQTPFRLTQMASGRAFRDGRSWAFLVLFRRRQSGRLAQTAP
jgi:hypothetical protein